MYIIGKTAASRTTAAVIFAFTVFVTQSGPASASSLTHHTHGATPRAEHTRTPRRATVPPAPDGPGQPITVQQLNPTTDPPDGNCQDGYSSGTGFQGTPQVVHDTVDLSQFDNQAIRLRFYFSTQDNLYNEFEGWYLKNLHVTGTKSGTPVTVFADPVTDGDTTFTASSDFGASPGWHVTDRRDSSLGGPAWWYGNEATGTFQSPNPIDSCTDSSVNSGTITSPTFTLASNSELSFDTLWQIESVNPSNFDLMQVQVIPVAGPVLGLGDSIAAGYGLGPAEGYPDNNGAYPYLLAQSLGEPAQDYAVEGACASSAELHCKQHSMDWQIGKASSTFAPSLVTVTVGANDIHFGDCLKAIIKEYDLFLQSPSDPCNPATLAANLSALRQSLTTDLQTLSAKYPHAAIQVMNYYNPFPAPPSESDSPCFLDQALTLFYAHSQGNGWPSVAGAFFLHHKEFLDEARSIQGLVYDEAQNVIGQLNDTIDTAATGLATVIDTSDFAGHDMCSHSSQWVFSPTLKIHLSFLAFHWNRSLGGEDCPAATAANLLAERKDISFSGGNLKLVASTNCTPHPTQDGQAAVANDFVRQG